MIAGVREEVSNHTPLSVLKSEYAKVSHPYMATDVDDIHTSHTYTHTYTNTQTPSNIDLSPHDYLNTLALIFFNVKKPWSYIAHRDK